MGAFIFRDHVNIGKCAHEICSCAAHGHLPEGCLNFIPKSGKEEQMPAPIPSRNDRILAAIDDGLEHFGWPKLDTTVRCAIERRVTRVLDQMMGVEAVTRTPSAQEAAHDACAMGVAPADRFCVIGVDAYERTYYTNIPEAEVAAGKMIARNIQRPGVTPKKMLVVKAVSIVEPSPPVPPMTVSRPPTDEDFGRRLKQPVRRQSWEA
jgi:hypothetical protein